MNGQNRKDVKPGLEVYIILKKDQRIRRENKRNRERLINEFILSSTWHKSSINRWTNWTCL